ncbi:MAG TPA: IS1182 family transposase, partial [Candidatus Limnocylindria bacterium]|nr:IS1182 family transposase [Candidatus Limnocylindria bacterium]
MTYWARPPELREQAVLFPQRLDEALPRGHVVRLLDEVLGRLDWGRFEACYHGRIGQPPIHPRVLAGVLLYGLWTRLRSSRALEEALQVRLDFRWLAEGQTIDHSTLSEFRRRHSTELKELFVQVCLVARELGLVSLDLLGFDGTRVRANNRRRATRTAEELRRERAELQAHFEEFQRQAEAEDARDEERFGLRNPKELPAELRNAQQRLQKLDAALQRLKDAGRDADATSPRIPLTDPESRVMPNKEGGYAPNYTPTAMVDLGSGLIVGADVLGEVNEDGHLIPACEEVQAQLGLPAPPPVAADGLMATGANIAGCEERGITLYSPVPVPDPASNPALRVDPSQPVAEKDWERLPTQQVKTHGQSQQQLDKTAFVYDAARDCYWCPLGHALPYVATTSEASGRRRRVRARYQAAGQSCQACPLRARCLRGQAKGRRIYREQYDAHRERHAQHMAKPESQTQYARRRHAGERPFAVIKQQFGLRQFLHRLQDEWRWAALAFNLQRILSLLRSRAGPNI